MRTVVASLATLATLAVCVAPASGLAATSDVFGVWMRGDGNAKVRMATCGDDICATNLWIKDTSGGEAVGDKLVMTVKPKGENAFSGEAYDPKRGLTYAMELQVTGDRMTTRGCVIGGLVCRSVHWSRAD
ncbi:DUF2147 domain-containing protein [Aquabacter spiritensis]|uniref:Uncharacterized protein (DUF2147 family) n=1 Tax=Aquabacter spiritensis TaxID=933073 RepID=A0A4R3M1Q0_9HYPH|nr:DUF2147 domain-containing protein [Aquabacter spiritensis]TCT06922.1 uncharacterized protein (DUF2147 family) [Aquabacter spiritensis]